MTNGGELRFVLIVLIPVIVGLVGFGLFNASVDPYGILGDDGIPGWSDQKIAAYQQDRIYKPRAVTRMQPEVLFLGTSRVGMGLDTDHPALADKLVYNLGLTGANAYEVRRIYQHAHATSPVSQVVLGLDFFMFDALSKTPPTFAEERLRVRADGRFQVSSYFHDFPAAWWSIDATEASLASLHASRAVAAGEQVPVARYINGTFDDSLWEPALATMGHGVQFWLREKDFLWSFLDFRYQDPRGRNQQISAFRELLRDWHRHHIDSTLFISPIHARMLLVIDASGLWPQWQQWKRELVAINQTVAEEFGRDPFPLIDCSGFHEYATEAVPELYDLTSRMHWYWEGSHFKTTLGVRVLDRIFNTGEPLPDNFGRLLNSETIDRALNSIEEERLAYRQQEAVLVKDIEDRVTILMSLKDGSFDPDTLDPAVREEIRKQMKALGGR